ncbi:MAG: cyclic nucleotide-binding protein [Magnetovibrio sp.]|nr:cyclic nucleotide-binding protein [Magnetovibrio sp.]
MTALLKTRIFEIIESPEPGDWEGRWFDRFMVVLILANVFAVILETVEELALAHGAFFLGFEVFSVTIFTIEYLSRLWVCTENKIAATGGHPIIVRLKYALTPGALIDLVAFLPFYLSMFLTIDLRFMRIFRLMRLLKLTRYSPALESFATVIRSESRTLGAAVLVMAILLVFAASFVYLLEKKTQPEAFASIPHSMWWALATLTTVGYGDVTPATLGGKLFGAVIMILGIGMFALPTGILATGFSREIRKREFILTWRLVAGTPLFSHLDALRIAEIANLLHPKKVPPGYTIVKQGKAAHSMYFIVSGEVEVEVPPQPRRLAGGGFFGEIALLTESKRTATVTAVTECQLLILEVVDFRQLLDVSPELHDLLTEAMKDRLAQLRAAGQTD